MAWSLVTVGSLHGITTAIAGITCPIGDIVQACAAQTFLLAEVAGICTTLYNGAQIAVDGDVGSPARRYQYTLVPLNLAL